MAFTDDKELIALIDASVEDQAAALAMLKAKPDLIHRRNRLEETALHFLAVENFPEGVKFLCRLGAEVDSVDFSKATPLLHAAALGYEEVVRVLLAHGANPNVEDNTGETVLSSARQSGNERILQMLIQAGAKDGPSGSTYPNLS
jgi:ankyrin repeat protein